MARPTVSIVIPTYEYARYLTEAIDSALKQNYPNLEVIVIDDGSTDDTAAVCHKFEERIKYHYQKNSGLSAARNAGLKLATGDFVTFLDADDVLQPKMIASCMAAFNDDTAVVACGHSLIDDDGKNVDCAILNHCYDGYVDAKDLLLKNRFAADAAIVRTTIFEQCGNFDTTLTSSEDRDMWIRIADKFPIRLIADKLLKVRIHPDSMSADAARMSANMDNVLAKSKRDGIAANESATFWNEVFAFKDFQVAWMFNGQGKYLKAIALTIRSIRRKFFFTKPRHLGYPYLFRLRALKKFAANAAFGGRS